MTEIRYATPAEKCVVIVLANKPTAPERTHLVLLGGKGYLRPVSGNVSPQSSVGKQFEGYLWDTLTSVNQAKF